MATAIERGAMYAEHVLEGKETPAQAALRNAAETPADAERGELTITADMEWLHAQLAMAYAIGFAAGCEERGRR